MDIKRAIEIVKRELNLSRFEHTLRVIETSEELAHRFGANRDEVKLAAAMHDYAKNWSAEKLATYIQEHNLPTALLDFDSELWHGPVGAHVAEHEFGITKMEILAAIRCHTTGKAGMGMIEKIVYLADYIEPGRNFPGLDEVRAASKKSLDVACWLVARNTITYLLTRRVTVHPDSLAAYNDLTRKNKMEGLLG